MQTQRSLTGLRTARFIANDTTNTREMQHFPYLKTNSPVLASKRALEQNKKTFLK